MEMNRNCSDEQKLGDTGGAVVSTCAWAAGVWRYSKARDHVPKMKL